MKESNPLLTIKEITKDKLDQLLKQGAELVDVREDEEVKEDGQISKSKHWPLSTFGLRQKDISKTRPTIFYCRSGLRSLKAAEIAAGWTPQEVYSLTGGFLDFSECQESATKKS